MQKRTNPLPSHMIQRYKGWHSTTFSENASWHAHLAAEGQNPRTMIISCCDSRIQLSEMFSSDAGEVFVHRNIANVVPHFKKDGGIGGTSAAIEYAVTSLKVANILIIGHSQCGGVEGAYKMHHDNVESDTLFLGPWLQIMKPGYERIKDHDHERDEALREMEKESVLVSVDNLLEFPFVQKAREDGRLMIHALWYDIGTGILHQHIDGEGFQPI